MKFQILHASDLHGSNICFSTLIKVAKTRKPRFVVVSGDISGKSLTPVVEIGNGRWKAKFRGKEEILHEGKQLYEIEEDIANAGSYPVRIREDEVDVLRNNATRLDTRLNEEKRKRLLQWIDHAGNELPADITMLMICGNDDPWSLDRAFPRGQKIVNPDLIGSLEIDSYRFFGESRATETPLWKCPRDCSEFDLEESLTKKLSGYRDFTKAIFIFHSPPNASGLDNAPVPDKGRPKMAGAEVVLQPVGSPAVRRAIERCKPLLGLHGHIHESAGIVHIGRTVCSNPGSDYHRGFLRVAWFDVDDSQITHSRLQTF